MNRQFWILTLIASCLLLSEYRYLPLQCFQWLLFINVIDIAQVDYIHAVLSLGHNFFMTRLTSIDCVGLNIWVTADS